MQNPLNLFLRQKDIDPDLRSIFYHIARAGKYINVSIRMDNTEKNRDKNATGDTQSELDLIADDIIKNELDHCGFVKTAASEEQKNIYTLPGERGNYFVAYDPYDGGTLGDVNITFGSILGIWKSDPMNKAAGDELVAACYLLYGPRVTFTLAVAGKGVHTFEMNSVGEFVLVKEGLCVAKDSKHFAPGNLKACNSDPRYKELVDKWISSGKKLRYAGALVTDINHILIKGEGIFCYPADSDYPGGRLRLLYEGAPLTFILNEAGGTGKTQNGTSILDEKVTDYHQRTSFFLGSQNEVATALEKMSK